MIKLTKKEAMRYKQRWQAVNAVEIHELRTAPMPLKFKQLCWLMNSFRFPQGDNQRDKEVSTARKRWLALKKNELR